MFRLASPWFLVFLVLIPLIFMVRRRHSPVRLRVPHPENAFEVAPSLCLTLSRWLPFLKYLALVLIILALARPQWGTRKMNITTEGVNIILALDLSESMAALDFKQKGQVVTRLEAVKGVINDFILRRDGDRIGMVVFGSQAFTQLPLTRDYNTLSFVLDRLKIGAAGPSTAIGDAVGIALKRLKDIESVSNIIILLTDGRSNSGTLTPVQAAEIAADAGVKVYTIGVGSRGRAPFRINDPLLGQRYIYRQVDMDHDTLKQVADRTGGRFFAADNLQTLEEIYENIDRLEKTEVAVDAWAEYNDLYVWLTAPALALLALYMILSSTRLMRIP